MEFWSYRSSIYRESIVLNYHEKQNARSSVFPKQNMEKYIKILRNPTRQS